MAKSINFNIITLEQLGLIPEIKMVSFNLIGFCFQAADLEETIKRIQGHKVGQKMTSHYFE